MTKSTYYYYLTIILLLGLSSCQSNKQKATNESKTKEKVSNVKQSKELTKYAIYAPKIDKNINFCGETVPIEQPYIYEKLDREFLVNMYWQSQTFLFIKRANKWFPIIEPILKKNNIPDDFKYLALIESGLMNVVSPSGAKGFWQFMPKTAKGLNLEVNDFVDERYDVAIATEAACSYLNAAYKKFNNWTLAAASYNMGKTGLANRLTEQGVNSYYDLLLNQETARYVYRILAVKEILDSPDDHGFNLDSQDLYYLPEYKTIEVDSSITDLILFAKSVGMNYNELKNLNPWLRKKNLPNENKKTYKIKVLVSN